MSTTTQIPTRTTPSAPTPAAERQPVWKHGVASAVVASVATTVLAAIAPAAGVSFADSTGASIPITGFAQLTLVFSLVGVGIAAVMARKARRPRATFVRTAVALTALSFVPDLTFGFDAGSAATLITLHTVAAAIVVPTLARWLARADQARTVSLSFRQVDAISPTPTQGQPQLRW
jgi:amino acid transporter